eukprot:763100-Hanusia_phi.AAC.13
MAATKAVVVLFTGCADMGRLQYKEVELDDVHKHIRRRDDEKADRGLLSLDGVVGHQRLPGCRQVVSPEALRYIDKLRHVRDAGTDDALTAINLQSSRVLRCELRVQDVPSAPIHQIHPTPRREPVEGRRPEASSRAIAPGWAGLWADAIQTVAPGIASLARGPGHILTYRRIIRYTRNEHSAQHTWDTRGRCWDHCQHYP